MTLIKTKYTYSFYHRCFVINKSYKFMKGHVTFYTIELYFVEFDFAPSLHPILHPLVLTLSPHSLNK